MEIEYASVGLGLVSIGLFFLGFFLGKKSQTQTKISSEDYRSPKEYDMSKGLKLNSE